MPQLARLAFDAHEPMAIAAFRLNGLPHEKFVEKIETAIAEEDFDDAATIVAIGEEHGHRFDPALVARTHEDGFSQSWRIGRDFTQGFVLGQLSSPASFGGAIASDYLVIGDLRDVAIQGASAASGRDYDAITLGLSLFGIAMVLPGTGVADVGASLIKTANKARKLSAGLMRSLRRASVDLVDIGALRKALADTATPVMKMPDAAALARMASNFSPADIARLDMKAVTRAAGELSPVDLAAARRRFAGVVRPQAAAEMQAFTAGTATIASRGGAKAALKALGEADSPKDLMRFGRLAEKAQERTSSIIRLLGKSAIKLGKLFYAITATLLAILAWAVMALRYTARGVWGACKFAWRREARTRRRVRSCSPHSGPAD